MQQTFAELNGAGVIVNVIRARPEWIKKQSGIWASLEAHPGVGVGYRRNGRSFLPPEKEDQSAIAARLRLRRAKFFIALDKVLKLGPRDPLPEERLVTNISASSLPDAIKRQAIILIRTATEFWRNDPDAPGLMDRIGKDVLGLTPQQIDAMFLEAAGVSNGE